MFLNPYIGFSRDSHQLTNKGLMEQELETPERSTGYDPLQNPKYVAPTWDEVYVMMMDLARQIKSSGYSPQVIVGVSRGGWPPARVMSDLLENPNLANVKVEFYKNIGVTAQRPKITQPVTSEVIGKRVLVVDDVTDSGQSLRVAHRHLRQKGAHEIRVCTLYLKPKSIFKPNHYAKTTSKWIIFPWERLEAINLIKRNLRSKGKTINVIRELKGSGLSASLIRKLLALDP
jgi:hypoxanthine phosphoribosyltransferase